MRHRWARTVPDRDEGPSCKEICNHIDLEGKFNYVVERA
jgi:hypothetical protein